MQTLFDRSKCQELLSCIIKQHWRGHANGAVLCFDLGHSHESVSDAVNRLRTRLDAADLIAPIGFKKLIVAPATPMDEIETTALAVFLLDVLAEPSPGGRKISLSPHVGIAFYPQNGTVAADLLRNADVALVQADWNDQSFLYSEVYPATECAERQDLERELRTAIFEGQLELHYQPLLDIKTESIAGFEALVRWNHPTRGMLPPDAFMPVAEKTGLVVALGEYVLATACQEAASWSVPLAVAINISPAQFCQTELVDVVSEVLAASGLSPDRVELEITETVLISEAGKALNILESLKRLGVKISLDDFGTGYSNLNYLHRYQFDKLKIDKYFIDSLGKDKTSTTIVKVILGLARSLGLAVTAEGVETAQQLAFLKAEGCDQVQGFLIGRPMPAPTIALPASRPVARQKAVTNDSRRVLEASGHLVETDLRPRG